MLLKTLEDDYRKRLNDVLAKLYAISIELIGSPRAWRFFRNHEAWAGKPSPNDAKRHAFKYVLKWACNRSRAGKQKASFYLRALKPFAENGTKPEDLSKNIERAGGLKKAASAKVAASKKSENVTPERSENTRPPVKTNVVDDKEQGKNSSGRPEVLTIIEVDLGRHLTQWTPMRVGSRFILTGVLTEMASPTKIMIEALEIL